MALMGLRKDEKLLVKYLPTLINMMVDGYHYNPSLQMRNQLMAVLKQKGDDSPVGKLIIAGFARTAKETRILVDAGEGHRAVEGAYNAVAAAKACLQQVPEAAPLIAESIKPRLAFVNTNELLGLVASPGAFRSEQSLGPWKTDVYAHYPYGGLFTELEKLDTQRKRRMIDILYADVRPELVRRANAGIGDKNMEIRVLNTIVDITGLRKNIRGWQGVGAPAPDKRAWRFISFDPQTDKDRVERREHKRFRDIAEITLPAELEGWCKPGFDDSAWKSGMAPIGTGSSNTRRDCTASRISPSGEKVSFCWRAPRLPLRTPISSMTITTSPCWRPTDMRSI